MKNTENKNENKLDLTKKFELDANEMNQIVGGTTFLMDGTPGTDVFTSTPDDIFTGTEIIQACNQGCKICSNKKGDNTNINICITRLRGK